MNKLKNGMHFQWIEDARFNEVALNLRIFFPLKQFDRSIAHLLTLMMDDRTLINPTKQSMSKRLDLLYGLKTMVSTSGLGKYQIIDIQAYGISQKFVDEELLKEQITLLTELLFQPLMTQQSLIEAKKNMLQEHKRLNENPSRKALLNAFTLAGHDQSLALSSLGDLNDLERITLETVQDFHQRVVHEFPKSIIVSGDLNPIDLNPLFEGAKSKDFDLAYEAARIEDKYHEDFHKGSQTELVLIYESDVLPGSIDSIEHLLYTAYLGQLPTSLLFQELREKHSLCYSVHARRFVYDGITVIQTGIDDKNVEFALKVIQEQIDAMKTEIIGLDDIKKAIVSSLEGSKENIHSLNSRAFSDLLSQNKDDIDTLIAQVMAVSEADIMRVAQTIEKPYIYAYRGEN